MTPAKIAMAAATLAVATVVVVGVIATRPPAPSSHASASTPGGGTSTASPAAATVTGTAPLPDPSCQQEPSLRSLTGSAVNLKFFNNTNETLQTLWLDFGGKRVFYRQIPAGTGYVQQTYITHPWIVADLKGTCLTLYVTDGRQASVTVPVGSVAAASPGAVTNAGASLGTPVAVIQANDALAFTPNAANVRAGDIVEWDNTGSVGHNVTFDSAVAAASNDLAFNAGDKWQVRFPTAGAYSYLCTLHVNMTGTITVR